MENGVRQKVRVEMATATSSTTTGLQQQKNPSSVGGFFCPLFFWGGGGGAGGGRVETWKWPLLIKMQSLHVCRLCGSVTKGRVAINVFMQMNRPNYQ